MQNINPVIQSAKVDALFKFAELVRSMAQEADNNIVSALTTAASAVDQKSLTAARSFLRLEGDNFLRRLEDVFREQMERAMRTMYTDLRAGLGNLSADTLTLIDDETVNRQIEVGRLVQRLRDACDENLGRLNIMIAQIHGDHEVRERENPFRPYLIARTLHDVVRTMIADEKTGLVLFEKLANALAQQLPGYYAELCEVFQAAGIHAQLLSRPTALKRHQRAQLAQQGKAGQTGSAQPIASGLPEHISPQIMPGLQRLLDLMQQSGSGAGANPVSSNKDAQDQAAAFQDFVWNIFNQSQATAAGAPQGRPVADADNSYAPETGESAAPASAALLSQLDQYQQLAARGEAVSAQISPEQNQLFAVREQIAPENATKLERVAIDVIAVLFEFILEDEQIPASLRAQIGRLQIPFLKAAMLDPTLLQQQEHPARQLLNRMGSAAVRLAPESAAGAAITQEITRIVKKILTDFSQDIGIFSSCLEEFSSFLNKHLRHADAETALSVEAVEEAEEINDLTARTHQVLTTILSTLTVDQRIVDFILKIWTQVLVRALLQEARPDADQSMSARYREILPELVWSAQEKQTPADRAALMRLLPTLVKRLKIGLLMIHLSEKDTQQALDQLVAVHKGVLASAGSGTDTDQELPSLEALRRLFSDLANPVQPDGLDGAAAPRIQSDLIEAALAERGVSASLDVPSQSTFSYGSAANALTPLQVGCSVECQVDGLFQVARLIWISKQQSLYMFKLAQVSKPLVYSAESLAQALQQGSVRLLEAAPTFDRAVESLLLGAETVQAKR